MPAHQPFPHELLVAVSAPNLVLCDQDGQIRPGGASGIYLSDRRAISRSEVSAAGADLIGIGGQVEGADRIHTTAVLRGLGDPGEDPTVTLERGQLPGPAGARETIVITSRARQPVGTRLTLRLASDLADISNVKSATPVTALTASVTSSGLRWASPDGLGTVYANADPAPDEVLASRAELAWDLTVLAGQSVRIIIEYHIADDPLPMVVRSAHGRSVLAELSVTAADRRLPALIQQSLADLRGLEVLDAESPEDHFLAAGAPWYLTLFGRDALIAARMLLPVGTRLAAGTLRALARRQGTRVDTEAAEEPGKIPHELRRSSTDHGAANRSAQHLRLPPLYYGTVDASALWVILLHDAWRWGMPAAEVRELLPAMNRALEWMRDFGVGELGFVSYLDTSGHGLANQGWKDSADAVQFADGRLAEAPVALCEVQAYAYAAAIKGAGLLEAFGAESGAAGGTYGAEQWRSWAAELADKFRSAFWVADADGAFPAIALDGHGAPVNTVTSNIGHLLGTGLIDREESALVVKRLAAADMSSGFGLRTMSAQSAGFNPLSYHRGSVWTHDTAIAITGLGAAARDGVPGAEHAATTLIDGLLRAAADFDYRMPELYSGAAYAPGRRALPYPASCRPQAWSAASAVAVVSALLGLDADLPAGRMSVRPIASDAGVLRVGGLLAAGRPVELELSADRRVRVLAAPAGLTVVDLSGIGVTRLSSAQPSSD